MFHRFKRIPAIIAICVCSTLLALDIELTDSLQKVSFNNTFQSKHLSFLDHFSQLDSISELCYLSEIRNSLKDFFYNTKIDNLLGISKKRELNTFIQKVFFFYFLSQEFLDIPPPSFLT
ncbi:MAG: hypothetical protein O9346_11965 [Leptospiraceae bacterium]|nr:hypothetical protein [Leptospiraceae bacterium]